MPSGCHPSSPSSAARSRLRNRRTIWQRCPASSRPPRRTPRPRCAPRGRRARPRADGRPAARPGPTRSRVASRHSPRRRARAAGATVGRHRRRLGARPDGSPPLAVKSTILRRMIVLSQALNSPIDSPAKLEVIALAITSPGGVLDRVSRELHPQPGGDDVPVAEDEDLEGEAAVRERSLRLARRGCTRSARRRRAR